jgi:hypothetical protein
MIQGVCGEPPEGWGVVGVLQWRWLAVPGCCRLVSLCSCQQVPGTAALMFLQVPSTPAPCLRRLPTLNARPAAASCPTAGCSPWRCPSCAPTQRWVGGWGQRAAGQRGSGAAGSTVYDSRGCDGGRQLGPGSGRLQSLDIATPHLGRPSHLASLTCPALPVRSLL